MSQSPQGRRTATMPSARGSRCCRGTSGGSRGRKMHRLLRAFLDWHRRQLRTRMFVRMVVCKGLRNEEATEVLGEEQGEEDGGVGAAGR